MAKTGIRAVGLLSGGLDSTLAARLMLDQGIEVHAVNFHSPFCLCTAKRAGCAAAVTAVRELGGIPLKRMALGEDYLDMVRQPRHGYGRGMNPCIDCRIMKLKKAAEHMREIGAAFLFTGEVLGQRPMSQHRRALDLIDRDTGLRGLILRPLSAAHLEPTVPEQEGWVDRTKLLDIAGRSRKRQMALAAEAGIHEFACPAGGCLLTDENFAERLRDHLRHVDRVSWKDVALLKVGRHRRLANGDKVIVARNEEECRSLRNLAGEDDHVLTPDFPGPVVVLQGDDVTAAMESVRTYTTKPIPEQATIRHEHRGLCEQLPAPANVPGVTCGTGENEGENVRS